MITLSHSCRDDAWCQNFISDSGARRIATSFHPWKRRTRGYDNFSFDIGNMQNPDGTYVLRLACIPDGLSAVFTKARVGRE